MSVLYQAASIALLQFPVLNSHFSGDLTEFTQIGHHNISIAMDTPRGLVVPNIKDVQDLSISNIAAELMRLQRLGLEGNLSPADLSNGTFSLSNIGKNLPFSERIRSDCVQVVV